VAYKDPDRRFQNGGRGKGPIGGHQSSGCGKDFEDEREGGLQRNRGKHVLQAMLVLGGMVMEKNNYCCSTLFIDCDHPAVRDKSAELTDRIEEAREKAIRLFYFVKDGIRYNIYAPRATDAHFKASHVLASKEGYCVQKAVLLVALARAADIPARLRFAEIRSFLTAPEIVTRRGSNVFPYHGLADLYINGRWVKATPTYDPEYCKKMCIAPIHFDGQSDALLPAFTEDGRPNVEYMLDRGFFEDLPIEEIRKASLSWKYMKS